MQKDESANLCFICVHRWQNKFLEHKRFALGHHEDLFLDVMGASGCDQSLRRFVKRFKAKRKSPVVHWNQSVCMQFKKCFHCFLWIHVNFAAGRRVVSANGKQCDVDPVAVADFLEPREISGVAAVKNRAAIRGDHKSAKVAVQIREETRSPVMTWSKRNFQRPEFNRLPVIQLMHNAETKVVHQISNADRHDDRLICCNAPQRATVEMIEVGMRNQDKINRRQMMNFEARLLQPLDHLEPFRPDRIDQDVDLVGLNKKRRVTDPGNADLAFADLRKLRSSRAAGAFNKKRRYQNARKKITLVPVRSRTQSDARGTFYRRAIARWLANNISPALFWKANWHGLKRIRDSEKVKSVKSTTGGAEASCLFNFLTL